MRAILTLTFLIVISSVTEAQEDSLISFSGYIFDQDSIQIENALLVSFRTLRCYSTNQDGFFKIFLLKGDSLMINHLSYDRKIIKANNHSPQSNRYYLTFSTNELKTVSTHRIEEENFEKNMKEMTFQMKTNTPAYQNGSTTNRYAPYSPATAQTGIDLIQLFSWIKTQKHNKRMKEQGQ